MTDTNSKKIIELTPTEVVDTGYKSSIQKIALNRYKWQSLSTRLLRYRSLDIVSADKYKALEADNEQKSRVIDYFLDRDNPNTVKSDQNLENCIGDVPDMFATEDISMSSKPKIDRRVRINGQEMRIRANSEEEYAQKIFSAMGGTVVQKQSEPQKHLFNEYAEYWFNTFSKDTTAQATAITYNRQLTRYLYPAFEGMYIEDITTADAQRLFNSMDGAKETKKKCKNVLNMIMELAIDENLIQKNPLKSRRLKIKGEASKPTKPYTVEQMQFLIANIDKIQNPMDRNYLVMQALHPLRPEETLGLCWKDVDFENMKLHINKAVTHPDRNQPELKETKTEGSNRVLDLAPQIVKYLTVGDPEHFVVGDENPLSYTKLRGMCERIKKDTGFSEDITPRRFRTTVLTDLYDATKDVKQVQDAAGHTTAAMTFKHYVKGRSEKQNTAMPVASVYGLA